MGGGQINRDHVINIQELVHKLSLRCYKFPQSLNCEATLHVLLILLLYNYRFSWESYTDRTTKLLPILFLYPYSRPPFRSSKKSFLTFLKRKMKFEMFFLPSFDWLMVEEGKWKVNLEIESKFEDEVGQLTVAHSDILFSTLFTLSSQSVKSSVSHSL